MNENLLIQSYLRDGNREALRQLLGNYEKRLFGYLWRMLNNQQDSEDALQETFRKVIKALPRYREESHFKSWLFRIGHNTALDVLKGRKKMMQLSDEMSGGLESEENRPDECLSEQERFQRLRAAIAKLPEKEKVVVTLRLQEDLSFKEIAQVMETPLGTILARMHKAKQRLKLQLQPA